MFNAVHSEEPEPLQDWDQPDDRLIGKAFRVSLAVLAVLAILAGSGFWYWQRSPGTLKEKLTPLRAPSSPSITEEAIPSVRFKDVTREAGIDFVHYNGARGQKYLPETMGGGVAFFDPDNDGDPDLFFVNSCDWLEVPPEERKPSFMALYENDGNGNFREHSEGAGLKRRFYGMGVAAGDYDGDGWTDLFVSAVGPNRLFRNRGDGTFAETSAAAGVAGGDDAWSTSSAWVDINRDGWLDLFVCNYVRWSPEIDREINYSLVGIGRAYGPPLHYEGTSCDLYLNNGDGTFTDISTKSGIEKKNPATDTPMGKALGVCPVDLDDDGWMDLVVANDTVQNFVFLNQRDGTFTEIGPQSGIAFDNYGGARGAMGIDAGRFHDSDTLGISIGNFANEMTALYVAQKHPLIFADEAIIQGIGASSRLRLTFGVFFFDYDLDGWLDLLTANGHIENEIHKIQASQQYRQPIQLFWNTGAMGRAGFFPVPESKCGPDLFQPLVGRGSAYADIDGDGDLDVVVTQVNGPARLFENQQALNRHWVQVRLEGKPPNRDAIGAQIHLQAGGRRITRRVMPTRGYLSQSELPVTIGLGNIESVEDVTVQWSTGERQEIPSPPLNQQTVVRQR